MDSDSGRLLKHHVAARGVGPLEDLASLKELKILRCRSIKTLPDTIQKLTNLQLLEISGCPGLFQWFASKENKMKLAHIKKIVCAYSGVIDGHGSGSGGRNTGKWVYISTPNIF